LSDKHFRKILQSSESESSALDNNDIIVNNETFKTHNCMREREREKERERELRELGGLERERSTHKETLLEILWCDDYLDSLDGVWNSGTA
jgi:hypothetical protein